MVLTRSSLPITIRRSKNSIPLCLFASRQEAPAPSLQRVCIVEKNVPVHRSGSLCLRLKKLLLQPNSPCRFDMGQLWTRISLQDLACLLEYDPSLRGGEPSAPQPFARTAGAHGNARWRERAADEADIWGLVLYLNSAINARALRHFTGEIFCRKLLHAMFVRLRGMGEHLGIGREHVERLRHGNSRDLERLRIGERNTVLDGVLRQGRSISGKENVPGHRSGSLCLCLKKLLLQPNSPCRFDIGELWTRISLQDLA